MYRTVVGVLILLPALLVLGDEDKPTPEEQYKTLLKQQNDDMKAFREAYLKAKTEEEKNRVYQEKYPKPDKLAAKFLELAEKNPQTPAALDALIWLTTNRVAGGKDSPQSKAYAILLRNHVQSDKMGRVCQSLNGGYDAEGTALLRGVLDKNPRVDVKAEACLALGRRLSTTARVLRMIDERPAMVKNIQPMVGGMEKLDELRKVGAPKLDEESGRYFKEFVEKYAAEMKPDRLAQTCQQLGRIGGVGGEALMRALLEKDKRPEVRGVACLGLAQSLRNRADEMPEAQARDADELRQESEELFDKAATQFADVKLGSNTIGARAKGALFELRHLSIGQAVPNVEGEDIDSQKFKLSDYRGKVVLLDFWGHW